MATTIIGRLAVRPRAAGGGFVVEDRYTGTVLPVWELRVALRLAALMAPRLQRGATMTAAYQAAINESYKSEAMA